MKHRLRTDRVDQTIAQFYRRSLNIELLPRSPGSFSILYVNRVVATARICPLDFRFRGSLDAKSFARSPKIDLFGAQEGSSILNIDHKVGTTFFP